MVPKFSRKDVNNFNEETLYKEYKEYVGKDKQYLLEKFNSKEIGLSSKEVLKRRKEKEYFYIPN